MKRDNNKLPIIILSSFLFSSDAYAVTFDTSLLAGASKNADLSRFYTHADLPPGDHVLDVFINDNWKGRFSIAQGATAEDMQMRYQDASLLGIDMQALPTPASGQELIAISSLLQGGKSSLETTTLSLKLSIPQAHLLRSEEGYIAPQFWDQGIPALLLSYNTNYYHQQNKDQLKSSSDDFYANINSGANLAGWQFRDSSNYQHNNDNGSRWHNNTRYLQRSIAAVSGTLMAGDFYTPSDLFDSVKIRGVSLATDINMLPSSKQGFAPIVRGVAQTNALVKIYQGGNNIYQESVLPGAFEIDNIQPTGSGGDLRVVVTEADGTEQSFTVTFSAVPNMLKQGVAKYSLLAGKVNIENTRYDPGFMQGSLQYGFNNLLTGYIGTTLSNDYRSYLVGSGWNLPFGALSIDVTQATTRLQKGDQSGQSYRVAYSKFIDTTATNFTLAAYRYSTKGYYSFYDAIYANQDDYQHQQQKSGDRDNGNQTYSDLDMNTLDALRSARPRNTITLNMNQRLGADYGAIYIAGTQRDYWSGEPSNREYQMGYANSFGKLNYNISATRARDENNRPETRYFLTFSLPLNAFDHTTYLNSSVSMTKSAYQRSNVSLSGLAGPANRLNYNLSGSNDKGGANTVGATLGYRTNVSTIGGSYSESRNYRQSGLSARGSVVAVPWHVLTANEIGNTLTIVEAPNAAGLMVNGDDSIQTNSQGLALIPYSTPYRQNSITLSNTDNSRGAEVIGNRGNTVPYYGAVNYLKFETDQSQTYIIPAKQADGKPLPFGTAVVDKDGKNIGFVGQASMLYIKTEQPPNYLQVQLNQDDKQSCLIQQPLIGLDKTTNICH